MVTQVVRSSFPFFRVLCEAAAADLFAVVYTRISDITSTQEITGACGKCGLHHGILS